MIDSLQNNHGFFPTQWRRWPGAATARPKKKPERRLEIIPPPIDDSRPKPKDKTQPTPLPFPLDDLDGMGLDDMGPVNDVGPQKPLNPQPFPADPNGIPSDEEFPLGLRPDNAPKPPDAWKQPDTLPRSDPQPGDFSRPRDAPKQDLLPNDAPESLLPNGGAAAAPGNRDDQARRFPSRELARDSRYDARTLASQSSPSRTRVFDPAARQRGSAEVPTYRGEAQHRYVNPLRSGTRTAVTSPPRRAVPAAAWSARGHRELRRAEPIRTSVTPRFNPLRP